MEEEWRPVVGYEGIYEVSNYGNVRSVDRISLFPDMWGNYRQLTGKVLTPRTKVNKPDGEFPYKYVTVGLNNLTGRKYPFVSNLVAAAFIGPRPGDVYEVCHGDGDATNNKLGNLRYDTRGNNQLDRVKHGTHFNSNKRSCPLGHRLEDPNLREDLKRRGGRTCLSCGRARAQNGNYRRAGKPEVDPKALSDWYYAQLDMEDEFNDKVAA